MNSKLISSVDLTCPCTCTVSILSSNVGINTLDTLSLSSKSSSSSGGCLSDDTQEDAGDHCKEEVSIISTTSSSRSDDDYPKIFIRSPSPPYKILKVAYHLSKKISDVKREVQAQLDLHPTAYTLQISRPWPKLLKDSCSLLDYNIHKETTLDIKLLRPEPSVDQHRLLGGAEDDNSQDEIDERLKQTVSKLNKTHGLQLHGRSNEELACLLREISLDDRLLVMKAFKVPYSQGGKRLTRDELINSFLRQKDVGFPLLRRSLMTKAERETERRAKETSDERKIRQEKVAAQMAQARAEMIAQIEHNWPTLDTPVWQVPGKDHVFGNHTDDHVVATHLFHARSGCWVWWELNCVLAYIHVSKRLILKISNKKSTKEVARASAALSKLNGLLELSVDRKETFLKIMETIFDGNDWRSASERGEPRGTKIDEEMLLEWFVDNESISLEARRSNLPPPEEAELYKRRVWMESLVGLRLNVPQYWWVDEKTGKSIGGETLWHGEIVSVCLDDDEDRCSFIFKCDADQKDYSIEYCDVKKYAVEEDITQFKLPKDPPCSYVDKELKAACFKTLEELRKLDGKILLVEHLSLLYRF